MSKNNEPLTYDEFNPAADLIKSSQELWGKHKNLIVAVAVIIVAVYVATVSMQKMKNQKILTAATAYSMALQEASDTGMTALKAVVDSFPTSEYAGYSAFVLGQKYLGEGNSAEASIWFDKVLTLKDPAFFMHVEALEGKGVAAEIAGDAAAAEKAYRTALENTFNHRENALRLKLALLLQQQNKLDAAKLECEAIVADTAALPGEKIGAEEILATLAAK